MTHSMPSLPYGQNELAPAMSGETIYFHYGKHLQTYLENVNRLKKDSPFAEHTLKELILNADGALLNNAAQAYNHILFFKNLTPQPKPMPYMLQQTIRFSFGTEKAFREEFTKTALNLFGSGWVWLAADECNRLHILALPNAGNPYTHGMTPLLALDVWEHAYYIDYRNRRADYVENFWRLIDWESVERRLTKEDVVLFW